jgi:hypothetical protein
MEPDRKRPKRNPLSGEEVAHIIAHKKKGEIEKRRKFKATLECRLQNLFNLACFFIYVELFFCYFGPCNYQTHYSVQVTARYGEHDSRGLPVISDLNIVCAGGQNYDFIVEDRVQVPERFSSFEIGRDYLLHKDLKGLLDTSDTSYRLFSASPALLLSIIVTVVSCAAFVYDLNENPHSLRALTILNAFTILGIVGI